MLRGTEIGEEAIVEGLIQKNRQLFREAEPHMKKIRQRRESAYEKFKAGNPKDIVTFKRTIEIPKRRETCGTQKEDYRSSV